MTNLFTSVFYRGARASKLEIVVRTCPIERQKFSRLKQVPDYALCKQSIAIVDHVCKLCVLDMSVRVRVKAPLQN